MKIAMLGHKRIPSREGGVEIVVEELATRMVEKKNVVVVYNRKGKNVQDKNADKDKKKLKEYINLCNNKIGTNQSLHQVEMVVIYFTEFL